MTESKLLIAFTPQLLQRALNEHMAAGWSPCGGFVRNVDTREWMILLTRDRKPEGLTLREKRGK